MRSDAAKDLEIAITVIVTVATVTVATTFFAATAIATAAAAPSHERRSAREQLICEYS